ncbi:secreted RxLR effector protein 161-like [Andrographis paniculata]|uniref:secreted RxLR effector protein 161-like n=1 Tax=Andrographis paniculata TaxID=175694 RepID=UPI0021E94474|nr:secreted RxLR effector protein 161-like [Andrographis paniculata]
MMRKFEMTDLGVMKYFLGIQVKQENGNIFIFHEKYAADMLKKFRMENCKLAATPMALNERLKFMSNPSKSHFAAAKRILRYIQGTKCLGIKYLRDENNELIGFTDNDWAGSQDDRKSTSGYIFCLGSKAISWSSKKQNSVAMSSAEAEYIAANEAVR